MSSIFGGSSSTSADSSSPKGKVCPSFLTLFFPRVGLFLLHWRVKRSSNPYIHLGDADLNARKEAVMSSVRNELALANAQELINVRGFSSYSHEPCIIAVPNI